MELSSCSAMSATFFPFLRRITTTSQSSTTRSMYSERLPRRSEYVVSIAMATPAIIVQQPCTLSPPKCNHNIHDILPGRLHLARHTRVLLTDLPERRFNEF